MRSNRSSVATALVRPGPDGAAGAVADRPVPFEELYRDSAVDAWRVARSVTGNDHDASDAVADATTRLFDAVSAGRVAHVDAFRPYLLTATRNAAIDIVRKSARARPTDEVGRFDTVVLAAGPSDRAIAADDCAFVARAFAELPPRWQSVLWLTEVEELAPQEAAEVLGLTPNNVSQLAVRARGRLRERYLQGHVAAGAPPECRPTVAQLGSYAAGRLPKRRAAVVAAHLDGCPACRDRLEQLDDLGLVLRRSALPLPALLAGGLGWRRTAFSRRGSEGAGPAPKPADTPPPITAAVAPNPAVAPAPALSRAVEAGFARIDPSVVGLVEQLAGSPVVQGLVATATAVLLVMGVTGAVTHDRPTPAPDAAATAQEPQPAATATPGLAPATIEPPTTVATTTPTTPPAPPDPAPTRASPAPPLPAVAARTSTVAEGAVDRVAVADSPGGPPALVLANPQALGAPLVLLVLEEQGEWLNVLLPVRPNGSTGWVHRSDVELSAHDFQIVVELGAHRITVFDGARIVLSEPIGVGTSDAPTPGGLYYTTALVRPADAGGRYDPGGPYGAYAYPLSGFSEVLFDFNGGDGRIGIHGTNDPSSLGGDVSNGCIRMSNAGISRLAGILPLGVPVEVVA